MKKTIMMIGAAALCSITSFAQVAEQSDISSSDRGRLVLERQQAKDSLAAMHKIILLKETDSQVIFDSEGRYIQQVLEEDLDGDNVPELLIQMDLGGSGGFKEFAMLKFTDNTYKTIWEETGFAAGEAEFADRDHSGQNKLYIDFTDTESEPAKAATAIFAFDNGEFKQLNH